MPKITLQLNDQEYAALMAATQDARSKYTEPKLTVPEQAKRLLNHATRYASSNPNRRTQVAHDHISDSIFDELCGFPVK